MKICILSIVNIKHMSLISLYTSQFKKNNLDYDIIYIDKYNKEEYTTARKVYRFPIEINREWNKVRKLKAYLSFKKYAKSVIKENEYDYVIVWRTETAILFARFLTNIYKGRYCLNVRDYCRERNPIVFSRVKKAINNADFTTISSNGYKSFLPKNEFVTVHSLNEEMLRVCEPKNKLRSTKEPIRVCFIGYVRFFDIDKKLLDALGNDSRYLIQYFGEGSQYLEDYAAENGIYNVEFIRSFELEQTSKLLEKADVINNLYGNNNIALDTAISTKYYYALYLNMPILVFTGTYMDSLSSKIGIGFTVKEDFNHLADEFYNWYHSIDYNQLKYNCQKEIEEIKNSNDNFKSIIGKTFLNKNK